MSFKNPELDVIYERINSIVRLLYLELFALGLLEEKKECYSFLVHEGLRNEDEDNVKLAENAATFGEDLTVEQFRSVY
jgi:hypothetical protein